MLRAGGVVLTTANRSIMLSVGIIVDFLFLAHFLIIHFSIYTRSSADVDKPMQRDVRYIFGPVEIPVLLHWQIIHRCYVNELPILFPPSVRQGVPREEKVSATRLSIAIVNCFQTKNTELSPPSDRLPFPLEFCNHYMVLENHSGGTRPKKKFDDIFIRFNTTMVCDGEILDCNSRAMQNIMWVKTVRIKYYNTLCALLKLVIHYIESLWLWMAGYINTLRKRGSLAWSA